MSATVLKGLLRKSIMFRKKNILLLEAYIDADYRLIVGRGSTTSYCTFLRGNLVT